MGEEEIKKTKKDWNFGNNDNNIINDGANTND